jgi:hypothetical protein
MSNAVARTLQFVMSAMWSELAVDIESLMSLQWSGKNTTSG